MGLENCGGPLQCHIKLVFTQHRDCDPDATLVSTSVADVVLITPI